MAPGFALALAAAVLVAASPLQAQEGCVFGDQGENDVRTETLPGLGQVAYVGGPHFVCQGGLQIFADSAVAYQDRGMSDFIGSVRYVEQSRELRADEARYFSNEGRLQAQGNVRVVDEEAGSSVENGDLVYLLRTEFRDTSEMTVTVGVDGIRPRAVLTPRPDTVPEAEPTESTTDAAALEPPPDTLGDPPPVDGAGAAPEPYNVVADRIFIRGSGYFAASGDVVIDRDSLFAYADSAEYEEGGGGLALVGNARVDGESYELTGRTVTMTNPGGDDSEIRALREARLTGEDLLLTSARIVVILQDGGLHRLVATPIAVPGTPDADSVDLERPEADVEQFILTADSLDVLAPAERLQRVFASGSARSVSTARDSLNAEVLPEIARNDWLEGDTVIIRFVGAAPVPPMRIETPADSGAVGDTLPAVDSVAGQAAAAADSVADEGVAAPVSDSTTLPDTLLEDVAVPDPDSTTVPDSHPVPDSLAVPDSLVGPVTPSGPARPLEDVAIIDTAGSASDEAEVEEIIARIDARSLYRLPPDDSTFRAGTDAPAVHYVLGQEIRIHLESGEVRGMSVTGQTRGVHLEPLRRAPADSAGADSAAVGDSAAVPDTGSAVDSVSAPDTGLVVDSAALPDTGAVARANGPGMKLAGTHARNEPKRQDGTRRAPKEQPWIRP